MKTITLALALAMAAASGGDAAADVKQRRVATLAPVGSPWMNILEKGASVLQDATDGRVTIKYYPGGVQGDERDVVRKMRLGQLDGAALSSIGLAKIYPGIRVLQLPLFFANEDEAAYVREKMWPYFQDKFEDQGFRLQEPGGAGWDYLYTNRPVRTVEDLRKVKMWAWTDDPVVKSYFETLRLDAVPLGVPDLIASLKTGRVDGFYGPPLAVVAMQWYSEITHINALPLQYTIGANVVRHEVWDASSDKDKQLERKVVQTMTRKVNARTSRDNDRALDAMRRAGVERAEPTDSFRKQMQAAAEKTWKTLAGKVYTQAELDMALRYRSEFRARAAK